jgi:hypothetical protein
MKLKVKEAYVIEGPLYEVRGPDEPLYTFSCTVGVETVAGQQLQHNTFLAPGHEDCRDEDYHGAVCLFSRKTAQEFADKVKARGEIDTAYWSLIPTPPTLEERWAMYALEEQREREGHYYP